MNKGVMIFLMILVILGGGAAFVYFNFFTETTEYFTVSDTVVCNISDSRHHVQFKPILILNEKRKEKFLTKNQAKISDIILFTVRQYTEEELRKKDVQEKLSKEIINKLYWEFEIEYIQEIVFSEFVII